MRTGRETQGDGQRHRAHEELAAVHGRDTGSGCREVPVGESAFDFVRKRPAGIDELVCEDASTLEQRSVLAQMRKPESGQARLARAEQLAAAADVEVDLRELEAVVRAHERLEPFDGGLREILARAGDQKTVRLLGAAADAAT